MLQLYHRSKAKSSTRPMQVANSMRRKRRNCSVCASETYSAALMDCAVLLHVASIISLTNVTALPAISCMHVEFRWFINVGYRPQMDKLISISTLSLVCMHLSYPTCTQTHAELNTLHIAKCRIYTNILVTVRNGSNLPRKPSLVIVNFDLSLWPSRWPWQCQYEPFIHSLYLRPR